MHDSGRVQYKRIEIGPLRTATWRCRFPSATVDFESDVDSPVIGKEPSAVRHCILIALSMTMFVLPAFAGRNQNGAMVVHTIDSVVYTATANYCTTPTLPSTCEDLDPNAGQGVTSPQVLWLMAAFRPETSPAVTTIQFGIDHNIPAGAGYFVRWSACGPSPLELPDAGWPETGFGNLVAYGSPVYDHVFRFYWFAVYIDGPENYFGTRTYPGTNEAKFVDDGNPPVEDLCTNFGAVRWDGAGWNECPMGGPQRGACCYCDGTCLIQLQLECGGTYMGDGTTCTPNPCAQSMGACCFPDGHCELKNCTSCPAAGGTYQGNSTTCIPNPCPPPVGACCYCDGHCAMVTEAECVAGGGEHWNPTVSCNPNPCPQSMAACCLDNGACVYVACILQCTQQGGTFQGYGTVCDPNPCGQPTGACCFWTGHCTLLTEQECATQGGLWYGAERPCEPNTCEQHPAACCFPDGTCVIVGILECETMGGAYQGYGTVCSPNPCPQPPVACCFPDGHCEFVTAEVCGQLGGQAGVYGSQCDPNPCLPPQMACCFADGSCTFVTAEQCAADGGTAMGYGTTCEPNPCEDNRTGACCLDMDGNCVIARQVDCYLLGGTWMGPDVPCDPNPCYGFPTQRTTWGRIKATYR